MKRKARRITQTDFKISGEEFRRDVAAGLKKLEEQAHAGKWQIVNTWNGGEGGRKVEFVSTETGNAGHNQCFKWIHQHTSYSFHAATHGGGYSVVPVPVEESKNGENERN